MKMYSDKTYYKNLLRLLFTFWLIDISTSCIVSPNEPNDNNVYPIPDQINDEWETASIQSVGLNENKLLKMLEYLDRYPDHNIHSIIIIKNNKLVFEEYYPGNKFNLGQYIGETGFDCNDTHNLCSTTKSFVSAMIGIAINKGFFQSVDQKVADFSSSTPIYLVTIL